MPDLQPRGIVLTLCSLLIAACFRPAVSAVQETALVEVVAHALPSGIEIRGALRLREATFFWTPTGAWIAPDTGTVTEIRCDGSSLHVLGAGHQQGHIVAIDSSRVVTLMIDSLGACDPIGPVSSELINTALSAVPISKGWLVLRRRNALLEVVRVLSNTVRPLF